MKKKKIYNSKTIRISLGDYALLREISRRLTVTMAEALHLTLESQEKLAKVSRAQIPLPAFQLPGIPAAGVIPGIPAAGVTPGGVVAGVKIFPSIKLRATVAGREHTNGA